MKKFFPLILAAAFLTSCSDKNKEPGSGTAGKKPGNPEHIINNDGIGEIKIGLTQPELEKILNQKLVTKRANDTGEVWTDTAVARYKDMDLVLCFEKMYNDAAGTEIMQLSVVETSSPLCKTAAGIGVGDDRSAIVAAYADNPITMGPENIQINDSTWGLSKTNYYIHVSDEKWDKQLTFLLVNKKVTRIQAGFQLEH